MKLSEIIEFNPPRKLVKGKNAPFVEMAALPQNSRDISYVFQKEFNGSGTKFKNGDTLLARITPCLENGKTAKVNCLHANEIAHGSTEFIVMQAKEPEFDEDFIYYLCRWNNFRDYAVGRMEGSSGRQRVDWRAVSEFECNLPDKDIRKRIGYSLKQFDDKIATNNKINQTLESISQTLFKSWFIDFDPVKAKIVAKEQGEDPQLAAMMAISGKSEDEINQMPADKRKQLVETADLFPDEMVESELGQIPKGWKIGKIGEVYTSKGGYAFKSDEFIEEGFPVVKIKNITNSGYVDLSDTQKVSFESTTNKDSFVLRNGDVIMAMTGATIGKVGIIANHTNKKCFLNQRVAKFYPVNKPDNLNWFIYLFFRREENTITILSMAQGSAQPNISTTGIDNVRAIIPDSKLLNRFNLIVDPLFKVWISNSIQSKKMSETRDILLPELLNGRLSNLE